MSNKIVSCKRYGPKYSTTTCQVANAQTVGWKRRGPGHSTIATQVATASAVTQPILSKDQCVLKEIMTQLTGHETDKGYKLLVLIAARAYTHISSESAVVMILQTAWNVQATAAVVAHQAIHHPACSCSCVTYGTCRCCICGVRKSIAM